MSRYQHQLRIAPKGMASAFEPVARSETQAQNIKGFLPGRYGHVYLSHLWNEIIKDGQPIIGMAWYKGMRSALPSGSSVVMPPTTSRLIVWRSYKTAEVWAVSWGDRSRVPLQVALESEVVDPCPEPYLEWTPNFTIGLEYQNEARVSTAQYRDEMFFTHARASSVRRLVRNPNGSFSIYQCGILRPQGFLSVVPSAFYTGDLVQSTTYSYRICWADERYRLSSPNMLRASDGLEWTCTANAKKAISFAWPWPSDEQVKYAVIFRAAQGTTNYYAVTCQGGGGSEFIPASSWGINSGTVTDTTSEANLVAGMLCPARGENDPPNIASVLTMHKDRLWCNDKTYGAVLNRNDFPWTFNTTDYQSQIRLQASHISSPTQFNSGSDPDDQSLGAQLYVGNDNADQIMALASMESALGVWKRRTFYYVIGDGPADWTVLRGSNVGCVNPHTLAFVDDRPYWLSDDGVYTFTGDGFSTGNVALPVSDMFNGPRAGHFGSIEHMDI